MDRITYFENPGTENTEAVLRLVKKRAGELGIKTIVIASTRGETAVQAMEILGGFKVIFVSHTAGFREADSQEFSREAHQAVEAKGATVLTTTHAFGGLSRAVRNKYDTPGLGDIVAGTLRIFGEGMKVVCEIALMAADSGLVSTAEDIISVAGTGHGADTAVVLRPVNTHRFFDLKVREIICKPRF
ncbi:MAG: pyruvate kinase alpha/beta domain-containing protein [Chloroflexota bacterium]